MEPFCVRDCFVGSWNLGKRLTVIEAPGDSLHCGGPSLVLGPGIAPTSPAKSASRPPLEVGRTRTKPAAPCLASETQNQICLTARVHLKTLSIPIAKKVFKLPSLSDFQPPLLCRLFHPFGAQLNQSRKQPLRRHSTRSRLKC